jgi:hypothetical protein
MCVQEPRTNKQAQARADPQQLHNALGHACQPSFVVALPAGKQISARVCMYVDEYACVRVYVHACQPSFDVAVSRFELVYACMWMSMHVYSCMCVRTVVFAFAPAIIHLLECQSANHLIQRVYIYIYIYIYLE